MIQLVVERGEMLGSILGVGRWRFFGDPETMEPFHISTDRALIARGLLRYFISD